MLNRGDLRNASTFSAIEGLDVKLVTPIEAAMKIGISTELLEYFRIKCPKKGQTRLLKSEVQDGMTVYDEAELLNYQKYLNEPWPHTKGKRPSIPEAIMRDVREECHLCCAVCGDANNGEVAHIVAVAESLNNSPDNLIFLCPNHHTQYDLGFKPKNNVTPETIQAAKLIKRESRIRVLRYEANATKLLHHVCTTLKEILQKLTEGLSGEMVTVYDTEARDLVRSVPDLLKAAEESSRADLPLTSVDKLLARYAPSLGKAALGVNGRSQPSQVRSAAQGIINSIGLAMIDLDEVDCPHCGGRGLIGLVGDFCQFCHGDMVVSKEQADTYDRTSIDEEACPRCGGRGVTGFNGDLCAFCNGSCFMSRAEAESYSEEDIDEVHCPRCGGTGQTGLVGDLCAFCNGSCYVTRYEADDYDPEDIDEVDCPRCGGAGTTGRVSDLCAFCGGSCYVSRTQADQYNEDEIDEAECPHCSGRGSIGFNGTPCVFCNGSCYVSRKEVEDYNRDDVDDVECPRCAGSGTVGFNCRPCAICSGDCTVTREIAQAYVSKYGR